MNNPADMLRSEIQSMGGQMKVIPVSLLSHVEKEWNSCLKQLKTTQMYQKMLYNYFDFSLDNNLDKINSIIIIALPSSPCYIEMEWKGEKILTDIPPVYIHRDQQLTLIKNTVNSVFEKNQLHSWPVVLPKKMIAAMSGFGKYGRNNLFYVEGLGSCHRITVFASDLLCNDEVEVSAKLRLDRCETCGVCIKKCPFGAINKDDTKIDADKCLTFYNEMPGAFPQWISKDWHNSLVGCTRCQEHCPENRGLWNKKKIGSFANEEVKQILENNSFETLGIELQDKLVDTNLDRYYQVLSRNISTLIKARE